MSRSINSLLSGLNNTSINAYAPSQFTMLGAPPFGASPDFVPRINQNAATNLSPISSVANIASVPFGGRWYSVGISSVTAGFSGPDFSSSAQLMDENTSNGNHGIVNTQNFNATISSIPLRLAVIAAPGTSRSRMVMKFGSFVAGGDVSAGIDLATGTVFDMVTAGDSSVVGWPTSSSFATTTSIGNGFYLCMVDATINSGGISAQIYNDIGVASSSRNISYTGHGGSGILVYWVSVLPKCAWTHSWSQTFNDDFDDISTIDVNDTQQPGFKWYIHNKWPLSTTGIGANVFGTNAITTPRANWSIGSSILTLFAGPKPAGSAFQTACVNSTSNTSSVGFTWSFPAVVDFTIAVSPEIVTAFNSSPSYFGDGPTIWTTAIDGLIGSSFTSEHDFYESGSNSYTNHPFIAAGSGEFNFTTGSSHSAQRGNLGYYGNLVNVGTGNFPNYNLGTDPPPNFQVGTTFTRLSTLMWPTTMTDANGMGGIVEFQDGCMAEQTNGSIFLWRGSSGANFMKFDTDKYPLFIAGGHLLVGTSTQYWPLAMDYVRIYQ